MKKVVIVGGSIVLLAASVVVGILLMRSAQITSPGAVQTPTPNPMLQTALRELDTLSFNFRLETQEDQTKGIIQSIYAMPGNFNTETAQIYDSFIKNGWTPVPDEADIAMSREQALEYIQTIQNKSNRLEGERWLFEKNGMRAMAGFGSLTMARRQTEPGIYTTCIDDPICKSIKKHQQYKSFLIVEISTQ